MTVSNLRVAIGDSPGQRTTWLSEALRNQGHEVVACEDEKSCLSSPEPDLYVLGPSLADGTSGLELLEALRRVGRRAPVILLDERPSFDDMRRAIELGAADLILHPFQPGDLLRSIERALSTREPAPRPLESVQRQACQREYTSEPETE